MAGLETISCVVEQTIEATSLVALEVGENAQRMEVHVGQANVVHALILLNLPASAQERVNGGELPASVACEVSGLEDSEQQLAPAQAVVEHGLRRSE